MTQAKPNTIKRLTAQKAVVGRIALESCDHPTAETIYQRAKAELPNIGLGTVYRILKDLVADGALRQIFVPFAPDRFDKTTCTHAHFECKECGEVTDVELKQNPMDFVDGKQGRAIDAEFIFRGICKKCEMKNEPTI